MKDDWKSLGANAFLNRGIRMSLRLTPNAHRKKKAGDENEWSDVSPFGKWREVGHG
jgi:hypothetical protein